MSEKPYNRTKTNLMRDVMGRLNQDPGSVTGLEIWILATKDFKSNETEFNGRRTPPIFRGANSPFELWGVFQSEDQPDIGSIVDTYLELEKGGYCPILFVTRKKWDVIRSFGLSKPEEGDHKS